jgi:hypothetical protein
MLVTLKRPLIEHRFENEDSENEENSEHDSSDSADKSFAESCSEGNGHEEDADDEDSASNEDDSDSADEAEDENDIEGQEIQSHLMTKRLLDEISFMGPDDACDTDTDASESEAPSADATGRGKHHIVAPHTPNSHSAMHLQPVASQALAGPGPQSSSLALARRSNHPTSQQENLGNGRTVRNPISEGSGGTRASHQRRHKSIPSYSSDPDSSWRPRVPEHSGMSMEVEEEIVDAVSPIRAQTRAWTTIRRHPSSRRHSGIGRQHLITVRSRPSSPSPNPLFTSLQDSQGSIILGEPPRVVRRPSGNSIPETQFVDDSETLETGLTFVPDSTGYFDQARRDLTESTRGPNLLTRTTSMPMHTLHRPNPLLAGHISMTAAFAHTLSRNPLTAGNTSISSPVRPTSRLPTLREETPDQMKSLKTLTRQASLGLGTVPESARKRMVSLPFTPPFKK